jgi:hypothetical protein
MQGIYEYVPEKNHVSRVYSVAAVQWLQSVLHVMLFSATCSVLLHPHFPQYVCSVQYGRYRSSLISCFPGMLLRYCVSDFEMVPVLGVL